MQAPGQQIKIHSRYLCAMEYYFTPTCIISATLDVWGTKLTESHLDGGHVKVGDRLSFEMLEINDSASGGYKDIGRLYDFKGEFWGRTWVSSSDPKGIYEVVEVITRPGDEADTSRIQSVFNGKVFYTDAHRIWIKTGRGLDNQADYTFSPVAVPAPLPLDNFYLLDFASINRNLCLYHEGGKMNGHPAGWPFTMEIFKEESKEYEADRSKCGVLWFTEWRSGPVGSYRDLWPNVTTEVINQKLNVLYDELQKEQPIKFESRVAKDSGAGMLPSAERLDRNLMKDSRTSRAIQMFKRLGIILD
ncbi:hypothetical protein B0H17DRAFT_1137351 [Mycena rosella]|uniref:Uncharacterized protein n=1 Tax=Mycena rosella TaxID=1033263 RepID=A0AAD7DC76_MYCRO|nr:hypothetical protein B0H17DRAFT_1137351 [Mycena rosella]